MTRGRKHTVGGLVLVLSAVVGIGGYRCLNQRKVGRLVGNCKAVGLGSDAGKVVAAMGSRPTKKKTYDTNQGRLTFMVWDGDMLLSVVPQVTIDDQSERVVEVLCDEVHWQSVPGFNPLTRRFLNEGVEAGSTAPQ